jgi:6-phosphofructokinase 1
MGDNLDNRALPGVKINIIMGRHAGFLTGAAALARVYPDDGPHLIYLPERPFDESKFAKDVASVYAKLGRCVVAVSEGICDKKGTPIAAKLSKEVDSHGNVQLSGSGALGDLLSGIIKSKTKITRVRADTFGYLQRSFPDIASTVDSIEAREVGKLAVRQAVAGKKQSGSVTINRKAGKKYAAVFGLVELRKVSKETRHMPDKFINKAANDVTPAFIAYAKPLVGDLPVIGRFKGAPVKKLK